MGINVTKARMPVHFEMNDDTDSRFKKAKIWIAHTGENLNNSYFSKEVLEEMSKTLPGIPIVGYIEVNDDDDEDFSDHRQQIVIKSGKGVNLRYAGHAYGFIPEDCNSQFELRDGKEWLTAEGIIWTKFTDSFGIMKESNGVKSQSMEIQEAEGEVDDIGRMVYNSAVFSALCILGEGVNPAMTGSTIEFFSDKKHQYQFELEEMIQAFEKEKGELDLEDELEQKVAEDNQVQTEPDSQTVIEENKGEVTPDENKDAEDEFASKKKDDEKEAKDDEGKPKSAAKKDEDEEDEEEDDKKEKKMFSIVENSVSINFQLSHEDQRSVLYSKLGDKVSKGYHYILQMFNDHAIVEQVTYDDDYENREEKIVMVKFSTENDEMSIGEVSQVFPMYLTESEKVTIDSQRTEIEQLSSRLEELSEFKQASEFKEKEAIVDKYSEELEVEVVKEIKANFSTMSVEDVEKEVALSFFKKAQSDKETESKTSVSVTNFSKKTNKPKYGSLDKFFNKNI